MPARITVYCRKPITAADWLRLYAHSPDYSLAAEVAEVDEDAMEAAVRTLSIADNDDMTYDGATRPIQVAYHTEAELVAEIVTEQQGELENEDPGGIRPLLAETVEIVGFELGFDQASGIGGVIAEEIAREIALATEGLVDFYGEEWRVVEGGTEQRRWLRESE